jgi:hypothetical protein
VVGLTVRGEGGKRKIAITFESLERGRYLLSSRLGEVVIYFRKFKKSPPNALEARKLRG